MTDMIMHRFGNGPNAKTVLLPSSGSWLTDAVAMTQEKKRVKEESARWRARIERRKQKEREHALEALDGDTVEIPKALLDALWDAYLHEYTVKPETYEIINAYLEERA